MDNPLELDAINAKIQVLKKTAEELKRLGTDFPAVSRNADRILASVKMLEINVTDWVDLDLPD